ncbi:hypothetical protein SAMN05421505_102150 [Sinosporangium album]|uniref:Uncharacterized protein n=1 Tax=Sinosporangium album TaxID=504805 RepID=A0A1G7S344_9ACTN|nr:hypothetical protein [Sinosporangium album]SDG17485.1 hypothetical protein SAMN05421505_102150 [Sinosporangium album]
MVALAACLEDHRELYNAALHARVRRQRLDGAHKAANALVRGYDVIVHEDLKAGSVFPQPDQLAAAPDVGRAVRMAIQREHKST